METTYEKITKEDAELLHKAIDAAREPRGCKYATGGKPCCVVGQYGFLKGAPIREITAWDRYGTVNDVIGNLNPDVLKGANISLLRVVQMEWDRYGKEDLTPEIRRERMHALVDEATA